MSKQKYKNKPKNLTVAQTTLLLEKGLEVKDLTKIPACVLTQMIKPELAIKAGL